MSAPRGLAWLRDDELAHLLAHPECCPTCGHLDLFHIPHCTQQGVVGYACELDDCPCYKEESPWYRRERPGE